MKDWPAVGELIVTIGVAFETVTVVLSDAGAFKPSDAVSVAVYTPSSVHVIVVAGEDASANEHVAPASTPENGAYDHEIVVGEGPSESVTLPESAIAEPSAPLAGGPASTTGAALDTETSSWPESPSSSVTVTVIVWVPPVL
jgi:hypothetical protein